MTFFILYDMHHSTFTLRIIFKGCACPIGKRLTVLWSSALFMYTFDMGK